MGVRGPDIVRAGSVRATKKCRASGNTVDECVCVCVRVFVIRIYLPDPEYFPHVKLYFSDLLAVGAVHSIGSYLSTWIQLQRFRAQ